MQNRVPVIVCGGESGRTVVFGWVNEPPMPGEPVCIFNARMVLFWSAACQGIFGFAKNGPQTDTRLTPVVTEVRDTCRQLLMVSPETAQKIMDWPDTSNS